MIRTFILLISTFTSCYCQKEKCGVVIDNLTKSPISYASIYYSDNSSGAYATEKGIFCLPETARKVDSVSISALGYQKLIISYNIFLKTDNFILEILPINLQNVVVKGNKGKVFSKKIGYAKKYLFTNGLNLNSNAKVACFVPNENKNTTIFTNIYCILTPQEKAYADSFRIRLRIYENDENNSTPTSDILTENIIIDVPNTEKEIDFDIKKYQLKVPEKGFWIGTESIGYTKNGTYIAIQDHQVGKYKLKNTEKPTFEYIQRIAPMYECVNSKTTLGYTSSWTNKWKPFFINKVKPQKFLFGAKIEYYK